VTQSSYLQLEIDDLKSTNIVKLDDVIGSINGRPILLKHISKTIQIIVRLFVMVINIDYLWHNYLGIRLQLEGKHDIPSL